MLKIVDNLLGKRLRRRRAAGVIVGIIIFRIILSEILFRKPGARLNQFATPTLIKVKFPGK
jgi:hypothetical protein